MPRASRVVIAGGDAALLSPGGGISRRSVASAPGEHRLTGPRFNEGRDAGTRVVGVRNGCGLAWKVPMPTARELEPLGDRFRPYRTVVAWYCWRAVELYAGAADSALTR